MKTSKTNSRFVAASLGVAALPLMFVSGLEGVSRAATVVVTPSNMDNWTLNSFDDNGAIVNSGPYYGTAAMVTGPAAPPLGVGSAQLATPVGKGDGAAAIATEQFDGMPLSSITSLSYWAYDVSNNGQQFPYLAISIDTGSVDNSGDGGALVNTLDTLFFEPPYQQGSSDGNGSLPTQEDTAQNQWQSWNAFEGGFWDNDGIGNPGTAEGSTPGVLPLSTFQTDFPDATIAYNGSYPGLGGIAMQVGFASDTADGYVDDFTIGVGGVNTTYDFEPAAVPEPASFSLLGIGALALLRRRRRAPQ